MNPPRDSGVGETASASHPSAARAYWDFIESTDPGSTERAGLTDADVDAPPLSLQESLEAGWITAGEKRQYEGTATEEDLVEAGYSVDEIREILEEQQDRACASST
ncbi:MAG: hypothetical protein ABJE95_39325 [Byssovorax sp.]